MAEEPKVEVPKFEVAASLENGERVLITFKPCADILSADQWDKAPENSPIASVVLVKEEEKKDEEVAE